MGYKRSSGRENVQELNVFSEHVSLRRTKSRSNLEIASLTLAMGIKVKKCCYF